MGRIILNILAVCEQPAAFKKFLDYLGEHCQVLVAGDVKKAREYLQQHHFEVIIADEVLGGISGIAFLKELVKVNPLVNTAVVSGLSAENFHEATEGLGVLMQLPHRPGHQHGEELLGTLKKIAGLLTAASEAGGPR